VTGPYQNQSPHRKRSALEALLPWSAFVLCLTLLFTVATSAHSADAERAKRVLMLFSESKDLPADIFIERATRAELEKHSRARLEFYAEHLDASRFPGESHYRLFREYLSEKYGQHRPDLVMAFLGRDFALAGELPEKLFPDLPVIFVAVNEDDIPPELGTPRVTGIVQRADVRGTLELILRLQPDTRRIVVIGGTSPLDRIFLRKTEEVVRSFAGSVKFDFWTRPLAEAQNAIASLPPNTAVYFLSMQRDAEGQSFQSSARVAQVLAKSANMPIYVLFNTMLGSGVVGGSLVDFDSLGAQAGQLAARVLDGTNGTGSPIEVRTSGVPMFDWRALKRWGVDESRLPPGSVVQFRQLSEWEQYKWYIVGVFAVMAIQGAMIAVLLLHRARRRRAEAELRENREFMDLASKAGELGLWVRDMEGSEVWANAPLRSLFGFGENVVLRLSDLLAHVHPDDSARVVSQVQRAQEDGLPFEGEFRTLLPDGRERWVLTKGRNVDAPKGTGQRRMGVVIDITERKRAEEKLRESDARFRAVADAAPVMIWMSGTDKLCVFFNKGWLDFTGRTLEQELGNGWAEGVDREDFDRCLEIYVNSFEARQEFAMEYRLRRRDGEYRLVMDKGVPRFASDGAFLGYIGSCIDITEIKRAEDALGEERTFLRQVIDTDPNFIFAKDREGRFTLVNQAVADAYGTTVEELVGKTDADFNPNREEVESFRRMDLEVMNTLQERFILEEHITDARGKVRWLQTVKRPIVGGDGSANQVLGASSDITRRKEAEAEIQRNRLELAHVTRVSTMGEMAASLAHELNQPLTAILSNAQAAQRFLAANPANVDEMGEILKDIVEDDRRAGEIIRRMWTLVKKEELEFAPLDLGNVIGDVVMLAHSDAILHNIRVLREIDSGLPAVRGDRVQLQQVVLNLLLNAFDAMHDCPANEREIRVWAQWDGARMVTVAVRDKGTGLSRDKLDKIFQPFFTTKPDGLGMGLSICRSIVEAHGGRLWAENNPDRGAIFYFTVPMNDARTIPVSEQA
jgi:PAS domain S-box-containing protein